MFIDPETLKPYLPSPAYFLCCFDVYDREETLGEELEKYNPNVAADRRELILRYCMPMKRSYRQKFLLVQCLEFALEEKGYDFKSLFQYDPEAYSSFPDGWDEMDDSRIFFEDIYRLAMIEWAEDLRKASLEDQATW
ncbi:hypothetical protein ATI02_0654 [Pseudomonas baetica]|uniref:Uncharacterized protein n=1 Tax=Pseudomonas baetica TaxID=674054 RepID=A0ABX4PV45_9PSED|nr:hypothetical protein [Pseudomonas baetica]PKA67935.1 hypothetical protein ATI02_0654 [Pseudomonas baetica]PTC18181.1 hypothetical protein C0J26_19390 [Pseudomonas baetica]